MTLIVENGSIVANANSYVDLTDARAYATQRGETLPTDDSELEALLIKAMDYLEGLRAKYQGSKTDPDNQELQWPRMNVYIDCELFPSDEIPKELVSAQCQLAIDQNNGVVIQPSGDTRFAIFEKVGPLETEYSEKIGSTSSPTLTAADALLEPLFSACGQSSTLNTVRV